MFYHSLCGKTRFLGAADLGNRGSTVPWGGTGPRGSSALPLGLLAVLPPARGLPCVGLSQPSHGEGTRAKSLDSYSEGCFWQHGAPWPPYRTAAAADICPQG